MTRLVLILAQLVAPLFPAGVCTCLRAAPTTTASKPAACPCCGEHVKSVPARRAPCPEPNCPSHPSYTRADAVAPTPPVAPPALLAAVIDAIALEPNSPFAGYVVDNSIRQSGPHLFLVYGVMLI